MTYRFYDLALASGLSLPELRRVRADTPDLVVQLGRDRQWVGGSWRWFRVWEGSAGEPWLRVGKQASRYLLRFPRQADFLVDGDGVTVTCYPRRSVPWATLRHLLLDQVLPLAVSNRGRIVLHASAVATPRGGVAFLAAAGAGKSTLAASLGRSGWPLVADDTLLVTAGAAGLMATASYPGLRLWPSALAALGGTTARTRLVSAGSPKRRITPADAGYRFRLRPVPLVRVYVLDPEDPAGDEVTITPLSRRDALLELVRHAYTLDIDDAGALRKHLDRLYRQRHALDVRRLAFPPGIPKLGRVRHAIAADLGESSDAHPGPA